MLSLETDDLFKTVGPEPSRLPRHASIPAYRHGKYDFFNTSGSEAGS